MSPLLRPFLSVFLPHPETRRAAGCPGQGQGKPWPWSFYIFAEIFWPCATCPPPLGGEDRRQRSLQPVSRRGRVRGWWACARPFAVHIAPLKALGNDDATSSTFSRTLGTALRCLWFQGIDPRPQAGASPRPYRSRPFPFRRKRQPNCLRYPSRPRSRRTALEMVSSRSGGAEGSAGAALSRTLSPSPGARKRLDSTPCCRVYNS